MPVTAVPVGPDYILGPGDEVIIDIWGMVDAHYQTVIDHTGAITLPKIGRLHLWGLSYQEAKELFTAQLNKYYLNVQSSFTLGNLRTIKVFVLGEAVSPGGYEVSSLATLFQVLYLAGGPNSRGSMRYIKLWRNNKVIAEVDLYHFLLSGDNKEDIKLQSQDTIFIPLTEKLVVITGSVRRPAFYELKEEKTLSDLINLAGGLTVF